MTALEWTDDSIPICAVCFAELMKPGLIEACASVGIEHGMTTAGLLRWYLDRFHERGHIKFESPTHGQGSGS